MTAQDIDTILADFRSWLEQAAQAPLAGEAEANAPGPAEAVDLYTLVSQFVALRHEVNLQTRSSRTQQEQNAETLERLTEALEALRIQREAGPDAEDQTRTELLRPLLKTLVDVHDALALACREVQRTGDNLVPALEPIVTGLKPVASRPDASGLSYWARWLGLGKTIRAWSVQLEAQEERLRRVAQGMERVGKLISSMIAGYSMSLQRLERALEHYGLEAIAAAGQPFDPETMEVVEVVHEPGRSGTEVIEEIRRGYLWQGRVFRFAQVRVARPAP